MSVFTSWNKYWRKKRKEELPQIRPLFRAGQTTPSAQPVHATEQPHAGLVGDPIGSWGCALEQFHSFQVSSGLDVMKNGQHLETAADFQNTLVAQHEQQTVAGQEQQPQPLEPYPQQHNHLSPLDNPMSMVPGYPGFGPQKPPGM